MPRLLWIGSPFFAADLADCGYDLSLYNFEDLRVFGWNDLLRLTGGQKPDVLVVADKSRPPFVLGMERFPCTTVFYGVDSHIHGWFPWYAQGFDLCLLSLRDHLDSLRGRRLPQERIVWSPAFAPDAEAPVLPEKDWDVLFVGTVSEQTPLRRRFLAMLADRVSDLHVMRGNYRQLYPRARIVLNICEHGDLNFRVFEALGCGACLLTPAIRQGFPDLFQDGVHLATYPAFEREEELERSVQAAAEKIHELLRHPDQRASLARRGLDEVNARHRARHRAHRLADLLARFPSSERVARQDQSKAICRRWLRFFYLLQAEAMPVPQLAEAYLAAAGGRF